ncbi:hypothetical protein B0T26DRAFT_679387 [Lasiosphaeria miniovina]|uniref:Uncharacterized protein n=1 Tax=Lasiosphaeria miniovina TaxID=1954250 RepID=A0AA40DS82_9PEZI|nr:uncharacterized protein B0T26DRAFT_679387 [Lasiosphaeria miniovina]KAK0710058.1 hypothetical protein B0T26DRAFT_679387 [Lasiosphaeria miniovina]
MFANALHGWDYDVPGGCYHTRLVAPDAAVHPYVDRIYLAVTCFYTFIVIILSFPPALMANHPLSPLHIYSAVALRLSNENFLDGNSEREGQVMALMLVADTIIRCGKAINGYAIEERTTPSPP